MINCENETLRDLLPLLVHDALEGAEAAAVRAHVASCAACEAELGMLVAALTLYAAATPSIDTTAILAKIPTAPVARPALRLEASPKPPRSIFRMPRYALAAAASVMLTVTLSLTVLRPIFFGAASSVDSAQVDSSGAEPITPVAAPTAGEPVASLGGTEFKDLGVDELTQLLNELDKMEATIAAEPRSMRDPITTTPEGL